MPVIGLYNGLFLYAHVRGSKEEKLLPYILRLWCFAERVHMVVPNMEG